MPRRMTARVCIVTAAAAVLLAWPAAMGADESGGPKPEPAKPAPAAQPEKPAEQKPDKAPANAPEKAPEPAPEKTPEKAPDKPAQDPVKARKESVRGATLFQQEDWDEALAAYLEAEKLGEDSPLVLFRIGWMLQSWKGELDRAASYYNRAIQADPKLVTAMANLAEILRLQKKYPEAVRILEQALKVQPRYGDALFNLARTQEDMGQVSNAFNNYLKVLQINPLDDDAANNAGLILLRIGNLERAARFFGQAIKANPLSPTANANLGIALFRSGNLEEATTALEKAVELAPEIVLYRLYLADAYERGERTDDAIEQLLEAGTLAPDRPDILSKLGKLYIDANRLILATETFERYVKAEPKDATGWFRLGLALKGRRLYERALDAFRQAQKAGWRADPAALELELALCLNGAGEAGEAQKHFDAVLKARPNDVSVLNPAALNLMRLGRFEDAERALRRAIELEPLDPSAYLNLGHVLTASGRDDAAADAFAEGIEHDRDDVYSSLWLYFATMRAGERDKAQLGIREAARTRWKDPWQNRLAAFCAGIESEDELLRAASGADQRCEALFYAAERRLVFGDPAGARRLYQECLSMRIFDFYEHGLSYWRLKGLEAGNAAPPGKGM